MTEHIHTKAFISYSLIWSPAVARFLISMLPTCNKYRNKYLLLKPSPFGKCCFYPLIPESLYSFYKTIFSILVPYAFPWAYFMNVYFDLEINIGTLYKVMSLGSQGFYFRNLSLQAYFFFKAARLVYWTSIYSKFYIFKFLYIQQFSSFCHIYYLLTPVPLCLWYF